MAEYINDTGAYDQDALFSGVKATDYDYSEANEIVWFSGTGTSSTGLTLPDSPFIVYEVYEPDSYTNNLTGGTTVQGTKEFTTDVGTVATTIAAWKTAYDTATAFTTYKVKATHYKGSDLADVYDGDEATDFGTATGTDIDFTGHSAVWLIEDDLFAPASFVGWISYLNWDDAANEPSGYSVNMCTAHDDAGMPTSFVDSDGTTISGMDAAIAVTFSGIANGGTTYNCLTDDELALRSAFNSVAGDDEVTFVLPSGTYTFTALSTINSTSTTRNTTMVLEGSSKTVDSSNNNTVSRCLEWTGITSDGSTPLSLLVSGTANSQTAGYLSAIKIEKTA